MRQIIDNNPPDSKSGDTLYISFTKINEMTLELYNQDASFSGDLITINSILDTINDGTSVLNHQHTISQIIGLQTSLNSKVSTTTFNNEIASINASIVQINSTIQDILDSILETDLSIYVIPTPSTGTTIQFDKLREYNYSAPATGNITEDLTDAKAAIIQVIYHEDLSAFTFPSGWELIGGEYDGTKINKIFVEWITGSISHFWITQLP